MIKEDEQALICDLAQTYQILDYRSLPSRMVATLSVGLGAESRIKMKFNGSKVPYELELLMAAVDRLTLLVYANTKDAQKGRNRPKLLLDQLYNPPEKTMSFRSGAELMQYLEKIRKKVNVDG